MKLYELMFDNYFFYLFAATVVLVRDKASVCPHIFDEAIIHEVVKGDVFEFIGRGLTKNCMVLCESHQD